MSSLRFGKCWRWFGIKWRMAEFITGNRWLSEHEMLVNARYIYRVLTSWGWTPESVCAMLGNMETESKINPGIWQDLTVNENMGFGLVQWTPSTKYTSWCSDRGLEPGHMDSALQRIQWEAVNEEQWIALPEYASMSFAEFSASRLYPEYLAEIFLRCYERPANQNQPNRGTQARKWYDRLLNTKPITSNKMDLLMLLLVTNRG